MKAIILADGLGTRISEETIVKPKPVIDYLEVNIGFHYKKMGLEAAL